MAKAEGLCETDGLDQVRFAGGHIVDPPLAAGPCDVVISHGVINPSTGKAAHGRGSQSPSPRVVLTKGRSDGSAPFSARAA